MKKVMTQQGRMKRPSSNIRITGGNQAAEGVWGVGKMMQKQRCVHRAGARGHAHAHAASSIFLASNPGLQHLGRAWRAFFDAHMHTCSPSGFFGRTGWTGEVHPEAQSTVPLAVKDKVPPRMSKTQDPQKQKKCKTKK